MTPTLTCAHCSVQHPICGCAARQLIDNDLEARARLAEAHERADRLEAALIAIDNAVVQAEDVRDMHDIVREIVARVRGASEPSGNEQEKKR